MSWGLVGKAGIPHVREVAMQVLGALEKAGEEVLLGDEMATAAGRDGHALADMDAQVERFVTVGGDGTILMAAQATEKPIFGINAGAVGFLTEVEPPGATQGIERILAGDYRLDERTRLGAKLGGRPLPEATNEVTVQTSRIAKLIRVEIHVDGELLDTIRGDGLITSTPTGSTGYAMSVGGPLVHPQVPCIVLAPISPFRLAARPWVIPASSTVSVVLQERDSAATARQAKLVIDGQHEFDMHTGDEVTMHASERKTRFIRLGSSFYERVRTKLTR